MFTFNYSKSNMALFICKFGYIFVCILRLLLFWMIIFVCHFVPPCELRVSLHVLVTLSIYLPL